MVASLVADHKVQDTWASVVVTHRLNCLSAYGIFLDQGSNPVSSIGRQILNHWTTRDVPYFSLSELLHIQNEVSKNMFFKP